MDARPEDRGRGGAAPPVLHGAARRARSALGRELRVEAERLDREIGAFYRTTQERAAALAEEKVGEAAARVAGELADRVAVDSAALRSELQTEIARAVAVLEAQGAQLLEDARGELDGSGRARLAEHDEDARGRFEALERSAGERVRLAETVVRERVAQAVAEARRDVSGAVDLKLKEEIGRLRATTEGMQASAARFRAELAGHLQESLGSAEERLRGEIASGLMAARSELAKDLERRLSELRGGGEATAAGQVEALRPEIERTIDEVVEESASAQFGRLAAELQAASTAHLDRHAKAVTDAATERIAGSVADGLALARRQLRHELAAAATERVEALGAALREELERDRRATRSEIADELGTRIEGWMADLRKRTDAAEKRLDEKVESRLAGAMRSLGAELAIGREQVVDAVTGGRGELEKQRSDLQAAAEAARAGLAGAESAAMRRLIEYVDATLSPRARRHELRLVREERERIEAAEARVDARAEELLRVVRVDVDRIRAEAAAEVEVAAERALEGALDRVASIFEIEGDGLMRGLEGELERLVGLARTEVRAAATSAVLDVERGALQLVGAASRRVADELKIARSRAKTGASGALGDGIH